ncbi:hypothetical protein I4U23_006347 [Adineta vaga]|nr:hypothetical protein I4U23_006347 [Adineta vaga]
MKSSTAIIALVTFVTIGYTVGFPSELTRPANYEVDVFPESRNFFQQLLINQIVNVLPVNLREKIDSTALLFGMVRHDFLLRCLKELQAFQTYSKIDFITAIQKTIKFVEAEVTSEQEEELKQIEDDGIKLATLLFENKLQAGELNNIYDLIVKVVRKQTDGQGLADELPKAIRDILAQHP